MGFLGVLWIRQILAADLNEIVERKAALPPEVKNLDDGLSRLLLNGADHG
jgi:hypothetical protein